MTRAPFQVLIFPFCRTDKDFEYAIFRRTDAGYWQGIAGGGEGGETPLEAARREGEEEAGISAESHYVALDSVSKMPVEGVVGTLLWGKDVVVIPEYCFGVEVVGRKLALSPEHSEYQWVPYDTAMDMLHWDSNKIALSELNHRVLRQSKRLAPATSNRAKPSKRK